VGGRPRGAEETVGFEIGKLYAGERGGASRNPQKVPYDGMRRREIEVEFRAG
jgi:hypothetical protein